MKQLPLAIVSVSIRGDGTASNVAMILIMCFVKHIDSHLGNCQSQMLDFWINFTVSYQRSSLETSMSRQYDHVLLKMRYCDMECIREGFSAHTANGTHCAWQS